MRKLEPTLVSSCLGSVGLSGGESGGREAARSYELNGTMGRCPVESHEISVFLFFFIGGL